jgi:hypothetical protein
MSVIDDFLKALDRFKWWRDLQGVPDLVARLERRIAALEAGKTLGDDREVCPFCRTGRLDLVDEKPDPAFDGGVVDQTWRCNDPACGRTHQQQSVR